MIALLQISKHRVLVSHVALKQEGLDRNNAVRNNGCRFMRCAAGISQIDDDEFREMSKGAYRFGQIFAAWFLKVKDDGQVIVVA